MTPPPPAARPSDPTAALSRAARRARVLRRLAVERHRRRLRVGGAG